VLRRLLDKLLFDGYETVEKNSAASVIARYLRGNTSGQFKRLLKGQKLEKLTSDGDRAASRLRRRAERAKI